MPRKRIYGVETEYAIYPFLTDTIKEFAALFRELAPLAFDFKENTKRFLLNGARIYRDIPGGQLEYATPECASVFDLVRFDKAGEDLIVNAQRALETKNDPENSVIAKARFFKNNTDYRGHSYGSHENYLVDRQKVLIYDDLAQKHLARQLIPFLVTRQIICGNGSYYYSSDLTRPFWPPRYLLSQRSIYLTSVFASLTVASQTIEGGRSLINTRDEPHADGRYSRLHLILGDSNMSEFSLYLKVGATGIVLSMIEDGFLNYEYGLESPVRATYEIAEDFDCRMTIELTDHRRLRAVELQRIYYEKALDYFRKIEPSSEELDIMGKWDYVLSGLETDPMSLDREVEWIIKKSLMMKILERRGYFGDGDFRKVIEESKDKSELRHFLSGIDLQYHFIGPSGLYNILKRNNGVERIVSDGDIASAVQNSPEGTRAKIRGEFIKLCGEAKQKAENAGDNFPFDCSVDDWEMTEVVEAVSGNEKTSHAFFLQDPFDADCEKVTEFLKRIFGGRAN